MSVGRSVCHIFKFRAVFAVLLLPNRPRLDCRVSGLVQKIWQNLYFTDVPVVQNEKNFPLLYVICSFSRNWKLAEVQLRQWKVLMVIDLTRHNGSFRTYSCFFFLKFCAQFKSITDIKTKKKIVPIHFFKNHERLPIFLKILEIQGSWSLIAQVFSSLFFLFQIIFRVYN